MSKQRPSINFLNLLRFYCWKAVFVGLQKQISTLKVKVIRTKWLFNMKLKGK